MANFGAGVYFLFVIWFVTLLFCWVSVRTGHYIGKVAVGLSLVITIILVWLPRGDIQYTHSANFYDKLFVLRYSVLSLLLICTVLGLAYCFIHACLAPVETRKVRAFGSAY